MIEKRAMSARHRRQRDRAIQRLVDLHAFDAQIVMVNSARPVVILPWRTWTGLVQRRR